MSKRVRAMLLICGALILALLYWHLGIAAVVTALAQVRPEYLFGYLVVAAAVRLGYAGRWCLLARALGSTPPPWRFLSARLAGDAVGTLAPVGRIGGDPVRIVLLHGDGVGGARASAGVVMDRIMEVIGNSIAAFAYVMVFALAHTFGATRSVSGLMIVALSVPMAGLALLLVQLRYGHRPLTALCMSIGLHRRRPRWIDGLERTESELSRLCVERPALLVGGVAGSLLIEALIILEYLLLFETFGVHLELTTLLMVLVATGLIRAVPVPASMGTLEASQVAVLAVASGRPDLGLVVGTVLRLHETLWIGVGFVVLASQGLSLARLRLLSSTSRAAA
jgi:uncharacterized protein (TIRG00374 family)